MLSAEDKGSTRTSQVRYIYSSVAIFLYINNELVCWQEKNKVQHKFTTIFVQYYTD